MSRIALARLTEGDNRKVLERLLEGTEIGRRMIDEIEGERLDERTRLAADLAELETMGAAELREVGRLVERASAEHVAAQAALRAAQSAAQDARSKWEKHERSFSTARRRLRARLEDTADPQVEEFVRELEAALQSARRGRVDPAMPLQGADRMRAALKVRAQALGAAIEAAKLLRYSPATPAEIGESIAKLRAGVPSDPGGVVGTLAGYEVASVVRKPASDA